MQKSDIVLGILDMRPRRPTHHRGNKRRSHWNSSMSWNYYP